jgi:hypothetical protein
VTASRPDEDTGERLDRELSELLQELRVTLPGVQVLFAFLLTLPFTDRFAELTERDQWLYFTALLATAGSATLLMAPAAFHRLRFRRYDKERLLRVSNRLLVGGMALVGTAMVLAIFVVTDSLFTTGWAMAAAALLVGMITAMWFVVPLSGRHGATARRGGFPTGPHGNRSGDREGGR